MVIVNNSQSLSNPDTKSLYLTQKVYTPGAVGMAGGTLLQLAPDASQYKVSVPDGAGATAPAIVVGFVETPAVYVPSVTDGATGGVVEIPTDIVKLPVSVPPLPSLTV